MIPENTQQRRLWEPQVLWYPSGHPVGSASGQSQHWRLGEVNKHQCIGIVKFNDEGKNFIAFLASIFQSLDTIPQRHQQSICYADSRSSLTFPLRNELLGCSEGRTEPGREPYRLAPPQTASPTSQTQLHLDFPLNK